MKRKHSHRPQSVQNKRDDVITVRLKPIDPAIKPLCNVNYTIPKAWLDALKLKESDKKEPLVDDHENTSISSESAGLQTIIDDLRDELSETRKQLDTVTLERNQYKSKTELTECKLWDEQDDLHEQIAELAATNLKLTERVKHLTAQNENLNKLINYDVDTDTSDTSEAAPSDSQPTYIVFNRDLLTDFIETKDITKAIAHILIPEDRTFAYVYDRITNQLQDRNVASFRAYYIVKTFN